MTRLENLLATIAEECGETAQRATKALRFGLDEIQKDQGLDNAERLVYEFNDIVAVMELLHEAGAIPVVIDRVAIEKKKAKVEKWLKYSEEKGLISDGLKAKIESLETYNPYIEETEGVGNFIVMKPKGWHWLKREHVLNLFK